jgi:hypothetical protein
MGETRSHRAPESVSSKTQHLPTEPSMATDQRLGSSGDELIGNDIFVRLEVGQPANWSGRRSRKRHGRHTAALRDS